LLLRQELGLAFDEWDLNYYTDMFQTQLRRDPTNVELFDIAQSNSEHSRHWFFKADLWLDGEKTPHSLFDLVKAPLKVRSHDQCRHLHGVQDLSAPVLPSDLTCIFMVTKCFR